MQSKVERIVIEGGQGHAAGTNGGEVLALNTGVERARNYYSAAKLGSRCKEALSQVRLGLTREEKMVGGCTV